MSKDPQIKAGSGQSLPPYREVAYHLIWILVPLALFFVLCTALYFGLRVVIAEEAPNLMWAWDAIWIPSLLIILLVPLFLGRFVVVVEKDALFIRFGFVNFGREGGKKIRSSHALTRS